MRVGVYYSNSRVEVEERPVPAVGPTDILIKVLASGICGSDLMEWYRIKKAPLVLGHELAGVVVEAGERVTAVAVGDRVVTTHHVPCDACRACLAGHTTACEAFLTQNNFAPGGFSEFVRVSGRSVLTGTLKLPDEVSFEQGSFVEPLGTAVRGLRAAGMQPGDSVLVLGSGIIGLLMVKLARALGAGRVLCPDLSAERLEAARAFGADAAIDAATDVPAAIRAANGGRLADRVMLCAGALGPATQALACVESGGTVVFFAVPMPGELVPVDFNAFWRTDVTLKTCYGAAPLDNAQALELLRSRRVVVDDMVTDRIPLARIGDGFRAAARGGRCLKVIVEPHAALAG